MKNVLFSALFALVAFVSTASAAEEKTQEQQPLQAATEEVQPEEQKAEKQ